ncbi:MAG TPA: GNAT family N-acetyltransferase [Candidatus Binataceae bacterium]|nr:GNAT family N-acetyltransferase [Candidatus Binataceae bacterium]
MNDTAQEYEAQIVEGIEKVSRDDWDALLAPDDSPFVEWDWLYALEQSGSASRDSGWAPFHILIRERSGKRIVAACPLYLKSHSMGEFVFDHGWADAAQRAGIRYYPKVVVGVPFTPHTGRRLLTAPGQDRHTLATILANALVKICDDNQLSSVHVNFCAEDEAPLLSRAGFLERHGYQYHWQNAGFATFDDYLARLKHKRRTAVRHERNAVREARVTVKVHGGEEITDAMFPTMFRVYLSTIEKLYWGRQYLTEEFFDLLRQHFKRHLRFVAARRGRETIAGAICLEKAGVLFGRYWGCFREVRFLHFEVCYYAGIEYSIARGLKRFEPGAGGEYKWLRGFDPALTRSMHYVSHAGLRKAIGDFLRRERQEVARWIVTGGEHSQLKPPPPSDEEQQ